MTDEREELLALVGRADLDALIRIVDALEGDRRWDDLLWLRDRCRSAASETGRQLWPTAALIEYRLVLHGPLEVAAAVLTDNTAWSVFGPLTEVIATRATWSELDEFLAAGPDRAVVAHERVLRGDDLRSRADSIANTFDMPLVRVSFEPPAPSVIYRSAGVEHLMPEVPAPSDHLDVPSTSRSVDDALVGEAVRDVFAPWLEQSNGRLQMAAVEGTAADAIAALGVRRARCCTLTPTDALALISWAAASGGAHGRRRGGTRARFAMWWLLAALTDRIDDWPLESDDLANEIAGLRWYRWDADEPEVGWVIRLAVEHPADAMAWAWIALDQA